MKEVVMAEIGEPDRVVRRERELEPAISPASPVVTPELEPAGKESSLLRDKELKNRTISHA